MRKYLIFNLIELFLWGYTSYWDMTFNYKTNLSIQDSIFHSCTFIPLLWFIKVKNIKNTSFKNPQESATSLFYLLTHKYLLQNNLQIQTMKDIAIIGNQAAWSILINMIIGLIHGLFYNPQKDGERKLYEVRTQKILSISNVLVSTGNIVYAAGTEDWGKLDIGGILVTLYRLFTDVRFITRVKKNFIDKEMDKVLEKELKELDSYFE